MFIVHVTPLTKGGLDKLSYFSPQEFPLGTIIHVPLRTKEVPALVISTENARAIKSILRTSMYETRKIREQKPTFVFSKEFILAAEKSAQYFATSTGSIIQSYVPAAILSSAEESVAESPTEHPKKASHFEKLVLQLPRHERIEKYKTIIRSKFAQGHSVFLCTPTVREARLFKDSYSKGIEKYTFVLESSQSKKKQREIWDTILSTEHPVLIVGTPTYASIPRNDIGMFILENEVSSSYKQQARPRADARILFEYIAREMKSTLLYAGTTVSLAIHKELKEGFAAEFEEHTLKLRTNSSLKIIDVKKVRKEAKESKEEFPVLSPESMKSISSAHAKKELSFIFAARRGIASQTVCNDCNTVVTCAHCASPVILHTRGDARELLCHRCGSSRDANETCLSCGSWNLVPLGIGIERIEQYVRKYASFIPVFVLSGDTASTPVQAKKIMDAFYETPGALLIGTEMALPYLTEKVSCSVVSSIDSLLCVPDFRIEERIFSIITTLREQTKDSVIIETSSPNNLMLKCAQSGSLSEYAQEELRLRKKLRYPPYTHLIKVTFSGTRELVIHNMKKFVELTEKYTPRVFAGFIPRGPNLELHALIRIPSEAWPDTELVAILTALPRSATIDVDPERTL